MNKLVKHYSSYNEMIYDFARLSDNLDAEGTLRSAPPFSFYTKDGMIALGGSFPLFIYKVKDVLGIKVVPASSMEAPGVYIVSFEDYKEVEKQEEPKREVNPVSTPAKKRSQRKPATKK